MDKRADNCAGESFGEVRIGGESVKLAGFDRRRDYHPAHAAAVRADKEDHLATEGNRSEWLGRKKVGLNQRVNGTRSRGAGVHLADRGRKARVDACAVLALALAVHRLVPADLPFSNRIIAKRPGPIKLRSMTWNRASP